MKEEVRELQRELDSERAARQRAEMALRALSDGGELIARHWDSDRTLQELIDQIQQTTQADLVILYPYNAATQLFQFPCFVSGILLDQQFLEHRYSGLDEIASLILERGNSSFTKDRGDTISSDIADESDAPGAFERREKIKSTAAVPLLVGNEPVGVLFVNFRVPQPFDDPQKQLIKGLSHHAATAIQNARNHARAEKELERFSQLNNTAWQLAQITDPAELDKAYDAVLQSADVGQESQGLICRYDEDSQELEIVHSLRMPLEIKSKRIALHEGVIGQVARTRQPTVIYDTEHLPEGVATPITLDLPVNSLVVIPLQFADRYYGNLALSHGKAQYFRDADVELMQGLAKQLAITIYRLETAQARHAAEQRALAAEVMSSLGQSTIELSHRLGNDLGLIQAYVHNVRAILASHGVEPGLVGKELDRIVKDVAVVLRLSKGLKQELAGLRHGTDAESRVAIPARELLQEATQSHPGLPANVEVRFEIGNDVQAVNVIPGQVINALRNLLLNAVEAMPEGGTIVLGARNAGECVKFEVTDSGPGIERGQQARIFDLFYSSKGGFGFGLWSARRNALANGGDLTVVSQPGHGTTFTLLLPRANLGSPGPG